MKLSSIILLLFSLIAIVAQAQTIIHINPDKKFQIIEAWEATANRLEIADVRQMTLPHIDELIDLAVNDLGITRIRLGMNSGIENSVDYFGQLLDGTITYDDFKTVRYSKINDNEDPFDANPSGFHMSGIDDNMEYVILPFKKAVEARGDKFYLNLCFVDFKDQSDFHHSRDPEEYAELIAFIWDYMDKKYNYTPECLEVVLEPDNADVWNQKSFAAAMAAAARRLHSMGFYPEIVAPSVMAIGNLESYIDEMKAIPDAISNLDLLCYHRYSGKDNTAMRQLILDIAEEYNVKTGMLEYAHNGSVIDLHDDLKNLNNSVWTKYALWYQSNEKWAYVYFDVETDPENPVYGICTQTKYLRQYFKFIRPGAQRIEATGGSSHIDPVAFENSNGTQTVVILADTSDTITIENLQPGEYGIKYTLGPYHWATVEPIVYDYDLPNQTILPGAKLTFELPAQGVATVYGIPQDISVSQIAEKPLNIYPMPGNGMFKISGLRGEWQVEIFTEQGSLCEMIRGEGDFTIDIRELPEGLYLVRASELGSKEQKYGKIIMLK